MKSKVTTVLAMLFMLITLSTQVRASENLYGVIYSKGYNNYSLVTKDKELQLVYDGTQDLQALVGSLVSLSPSELDENSVHTNEITSVTGYQKNVQTSKKQYVKVIYENNAYFYVSGDQKTELRGNINLQPFIGTYCDIDVISSTYTYGDITINIPWEEVSTINPGNPLKIMYKQVILNGTIRIVDNKCYVTVKDKLYAMNFDNAADAVKYSLLDKRYVTVTGKEKYIIDLRTNAQKEGYSIYSPKYTLTTRVTKYQPVVVTGLINNELKISKYSLDKSFGRYKGFVMHVAGKMAINSNGIKESPSMVIIPTSLQQVDTINSRVYNYLNNLNRRNNTFKQAKALNKGSAHNGCVYFSSQALRNVGISISKKVSFTHHFASNLQQKGWKKITDYRKLSVGSVCFTKDPHGGNGKPTHAYIFMGWVKQGDYTQAYICDNQAGDYGGQVLHIRNISIKVKHNGNYKDAFNYALISPSTYNYIN